MSIGSDHNPPEQVAKGSPVNSRSKTWSILGLAIIIVMAIAYVYAIRDQFHIFENIIFSFIPQILILSLALVITAGITNAILLALAGYRLSLTEICTLSIMTTFFNYFGPLRTGAVVRATYLKKVKNTPYSSYVGIMAANLLFILFTAGLMCAMMIPYFYSLSPVYLKVMVFLTILLLSFPVIIYVFRPRNLTPRNRMFNMLSLALEQLNIISRNRLGVFFIILSIMAQYGIGSLLILFSYRTFSVNPEFFSCLAIGVFQSISSFITLTPNNLGIQEFIMAIMGKITQLGFSQSLIVAGIIRLSSLIVTFSLAPISWYILLKQKSFSPRQHSNENIFKMEDSEHD